MLFSDFSLGWQVAYERDKKPNAEDALMRNGSTTQLCHGDEPDKNPVLLLIFVSPPVINRGMGYS